MVRDFGFGIVIHQEGLEHTQSRHTICAKALTNSQNIYVVSPKYQFATSIHGRCYMYTATATAVALEIKRRIRGI